MFLLKLGVWGGTESKVRSLDLESHAMRQIVSRK